jgi:hypothetical protein
MVCAQCELQELLEIGNKQHPELVRPGEELVYNLESGEADLGVVLGQLCHQQTVGMVELLL